MHIDHNWWSVSTLATTKHIDNNSVRSHDVVVTARCKSEFGPARSIQIQDSIGFIKLLKIF